MRLILSAFALLAVAAVPTAAFASSIDLSTGPTTGTAPAANSLYTYSYTPTGQSAATGGTAYTVTPNSAWSSAIAGTSWISTTAAGGTTSAQASTVFTFTSSTSFTAVAGETVTGSFLSDNNASVQLFDITSGTPVAFGSAVSNSGASTYLNPATSFYFTGMKAGDIYDLVGSVTNTTTDTANTGNPVGLDIKATAVTPEPSSLALLGTGLAGIAGFARRKMRA